MYLGRISVSSSELKRTRTQAKNELLSNDSSEKMTLPDKADSEFQRRSSDEFKDINQISQWKSRIEDATR